MPPPAPIFWKKVDENQVSYFIWPNAHAGCACHCLIKYAAFFPALALVSTGARGAYVRSLIVIIIEQYNVYYCQ